MTESRISDLIRQGVMYRFDGLKDPIANGAQFYFVAKASANKNLIVEGFDIHSTIDEFEYGLYVDGAYTGGTPVAVTNNMDATHNTQLEGQIINTPTVTGAPLLLTNANIGGFITNGGFSHREPFVIPKGHHMLVMIDNDNRGGTAARMMIKIYMREAGR